MGAPDQFVLRLKNLLSIGAAVVGISACGVGLSPLPSEQANVKVEVSSEQGLSLGQSSRFRVLAAGATAKLWVLRGELSTYALGQIRRDEPSQALLDRRIPSLNWSEGDSARVVAPLEALSGAISLVELGRGVLFQGTVDMSGQMLRRVWPTSGQSAGQVALFCRDAAGPLPSLDGTEATLAPSGQALSVVPGLPLGLEALRCVRLRVQSNEQLEGSGVSVSPVALSGFALEPTLFEPNAPAAWGPAEAPCAEGMLPLPAGCASVMDDRLAISVDRASYVSVKLGAEERAFALGAGEQQSFLGLEPETLYSLSIAVLNPAGLERTAQLDITTTRASPRVVLNEVFANPKGPEPQQEWIELYNDGRAPADLAGFVLEDSAGTTALPSAILPPGRYALLVNESFDARNGADPLPDPFAQLLRVPHLGTNGLSNSGEMLKLRDAAGVLVSSFPADPAPVSGISVCRKQPGSEGLTAYALHTAPGSSPGAENFTPSP